jgi:hypothetical protein
VICAVHPVAGGLCLAPSLQPAQQGTSGEGQVCTSYALQLQGYWPGHVSGVHVLRHTILRLPKTIGHSRRSCHARPTHTDR